MIAEVMAEYNADPRESQRALKTLISNLPGMYYRCRNDADWTSEFVSDGAFGLTGFSAEEFIAGRVAYNDLIHPADRERLWADTQAAVAARRPFQQEYRLLLADGQEKWVWEQGRGVFDEDGALSALEGLVLDINTRKRAEVAIAQQAHMLAEQARLLDLAHDAIMVWDLRTGSVRFWNSGSVDLYGWTSTEAVGRTPQQLLDTMFPRPLAEINAELVRTGRWEGELRHRRRDGSQVVVASRWALQTYEDGRPATVLGINRDITETKRVEAVLTHQANHDALTDLPNRVLLRRRVEQAIEDARGSPEGPALLMIDLDRFKEVNDTFGHHDGDELLLELARRLRAALMQGETVARLGGDEFAILLPRTEATRACARAEALLQRLSVPVLVRGHRLTMGASIGIALAPDHGTDFDTLLRRADVAMYLAKTEGSRWSIYAPDQDRNSPDNLALVGELRRAIEADGLVLHYQPKFACLRGARVGVEALVRWPHPQRGLVPPDQFIPQAEQTGLIRPLTHWVLRTALRQCRAWRDAGIDMPVAINLSMRCLHDPDLPATVRHELERRRLPPSALEIEITESTLMGDPHRAQAVLAELSEMGIRIAIDDFGTGYSSLAYLKDLPVHELKIDRVFVRSLTQHARDRAIVRSIIDLAHNLGLRVVAEGVEDAATLELLTRMGCDVAQGFLLGRPEPAQAVLDQPPALARAA